MNDESARPVRLLYILLLWLTAIALAASIMGMVFEDFLARFPTTTF
jgi:hypothetical protein